MLKVQREKTEIAIGIEINQSGAMLLSVGSHVHHDASWLLVHLSLVLNSALRSTLQRLFSLFSLTGFSFKWSGFSLLITCPKMVACYLYILFVSMHNPYRY